MSELVPIDISRIYRKKAGRETSKNQVIYWMQQAQRAHANPALDYARGIAQEKNLPLYVYFVLFKSISDARASHYRFMLTGLAETGNYLEEQSIRLRICFSEKAELPEEITCNAAYLVFDHGYLSWQKKLRDRLFASEVLKDCEITEIDTEAVVPVHLASSKEEYSAATLRPKLVRRLSAFLQSQNTTKTFSQKPTKSQALPNEYCGSFRDDKELWQWAKQKLEIPEETLQEYPVKPGHCNGIACLLDFCEHKLKDYAILRNHPNLDIQSNMSAYLHFGQISPQEITSRICSAKDIPLSDIPDMIMSKNSLQGIHQSIAAYAEELIVRRELAMNFCQYNLHYESSQALPQWARKSLNDHLGDPRETEYSLERLELGETDDIYWNAAQRQMLRTGKMHNYMRMYWGKRILAWFPSVEEAYSVLAYLNNKYELDGRDANAWAGIAWCFGKHDRPWAVRPIYGMIRYMNAGGLKRKFDIDEYVRQWR